jgi:hypothetical protein
MAMSINYCVVAVNFLAQRFPSVIWSKRISMQYCSYEALRMFFGLQLGVAGLAVARRGLVS